MNTSLSSPSAAPEPAAMSGREIDIRSADGGTPLIPAATLDRFGSLSERNQRRVLDLLAAFRRLESARSVQSGCKAEAALATARGQKGFPSASRLRALYYTWLRAGRDWTALVNAAAESKTCARHPVEFVEYWRGLCEESQRVTATAYHRMLDAWNSGAEIPGYGRWTEWFQRTYPTIPLPSACPGVPDSWHIRTLYRLAPGKTALRLARQGAAAAMELLPDIQSDLSTLRPMEIIVFDDVEFDFLIVVPPYPRPVKLRALVAMDLATRMILRFGLRPALPRDDGSEAGLILADMRALVGGIFSTFGHPPYPCVLLTEHATAAINDGTARALEQLTGGLVTVRRTAILGGKSILAGGFADRSGGNPRGKGWLESSFNLVHNRLDWVPGQKGRRYDAGPAELHGRQAEARRLLALVGDLPPHLADALVLPFKSLEEARVIIQDCFNRMVRRHDHALQGFDQTLRWRWAEHEPWRSEDELRAAALQIPDIYDRILIDKIPESPLQRWTRLTAGIQFNKFPEAILPRFLDEHDQVTVEHGECIIRRMDRRYAVRAGQVLADGKYLAHWDPQAPEAIHLVNHLGGYVGSLTLKARLTRGAQQDLDALAERIREKTSQFNSLTRDYNSRHRDRIASNLAAREANLEVLQRAVSVDIAPHAAAVGEVMDAVRKHKDQGRARTRAKQAATAAYVADLNDGEGSPMKLD